jgi:hypothetical protein
VQLNLHAYRQPIAQDPFRKDSRVQSAMDWRKQYRAGAVQPMPTHHLDCPPVITFVTKHKLYLIMAGEALNVAPEIFFHLSGTGRLDIQDPGHALIHSGYIQRATGFQ